MPQPDGPAFKDCQAENAACACGKEGGESSLAYHLGRFDYFLASFCFTGNVFATTFTRLPANSPKKFSAGDLPDFSPLITQGLSGSISRAKPYF